MIVCPALYFFPDRAQKLRLFHDFTVSGGVVEEQEQLKQSRCARNGPSMVRLFWGILNTSTPTHAINPSFWHLHNNKISHTLLFSVRYYLVVGRAGSNKVFFILREGNPSI
jgi:hypothetical protein